MTNVTEVLSREHRHIDGLLAGFEATGDATKAVEGCALLERHIELERRVICPCLCSEVSDGLARHLEMHYTALRHLMGQLRRCDDDRRYLQLVTLLRHALRSHAEEEEAKVLPAMQHRLGVQAMAVLMDQLVAERQRLATSEEMVIDITISRRISTSA
jgi:hypothetical protein